jgi:hypothetical protein
MGIPVPSIDGFQKAMEKAIGQQISKAAQAAENFVEKNEAQSDARQVTSQVPTPAPPGQQGFLMEVKEQVTQAARNAASKPIISGDWAPVWIGLPVLALLVLWRRRTVSLR